VIKPGRLSDLRQAIVNNRTLAHLSLSLGLHLFVQHSSIDVQKELQAADHQFKVANLDVKALWVSDIFFLNVISE
jgi:dsRNA-specific ribonuclease